VNANIFIWISIVLYYCGGSMASLTVSTPDRFNEIKKEFPDIKWNEVMKAVILKRLDGLRKFEEFKHRGAL